MHPRFVSPSAAMRGSRERSIAYISFWGSTEQGGPARMGSAARSTSLALIVAGQIDREEPGIAAAAARIGRLLAEIHQHAAIGRPGRSLDVEILRQQPFAGPIRPHDPDVE